MNIYLVTVSQPLTGSNENLVEVRRGWNFSPDVLNYPIDKIEAESKRDAYRQYINTHNLNFRFWGDVI